MVRVMVIRAEVMPGRILVATAEVVEQEMIQVQLKRALMALMEQEVQVIQPAPCMAEERGKGIQPVILANLLGNEMPEGVVQTEI